MKDRNSTERERESNDTIEYHREQYIILTQANGGQQLDGILRRVALREERLDHVMAEGQRDDRLRRGPDDEQGYPHAKEGRQGTEGRVNVGIVPARPRDGRAKLRVAQGA